jgi:hypothetical protein
MRGLLPMVALVGVVPAVAAAIFPVKMEGEDPRGSARSSLSHDQHDGGDLAGQGQSRHFRPGSTTARIGSIEGIWESRFQAWSFLPSANRSLRAS